MSLAQKAAESYKSALYPQVDKTSFLAILTEFELAVERCLSSADQAHIQSGTKQRKAGGWFGEIMNNPTRVVGVTLSLDNERTSAEGFVATELTERTREPRAMVMGEHISRHRVLVYYKLTAGGIAQAVLSSGNFIQKPLNPTIAVDINFQTLDTLISQVRNSVTRKSSSELLVFTEHLRE